MTRSSHVIHAGCAVLRRHRYYIINGIHYRGGFPDCVSGKMHIGPVGSIRKPTPPPPSRGNVRHRIVPDLLRPRRRQRAIARLARGAAVVLLVVVLGRCRGANGGQRLLDVVVVVVLARVGALVLEPLEDLVDGKGEEGAHQWADPVDVVVADEALDAGGAEGSRRVDGSAGVVDADDVGDEDGDANANGREVRGLVLLHGEEVHRQHELRGEEHFQEDALDLGGSVAERVGHGERSREQPVHDGGGGDGRNKLGRDDEDASEGLDGTN